MYLLHSTPHVQEILETGYLLPGSQSGNSLLSGDTKSRYIFFNIVSPEFNYRPIYHEGLYFTPQLLTNRKFGLSYIWKAGLTDKTSKGGNDLVTSTLESFLKTLFAIFKEPKSREEKLISGMYKDDTCPMTHELVLYRKANLKHLKYVLVSPKNPKKEKIARIIQKNYPNVKLISRYNEIMF